VKVLLIQPKKPEKAIGGEDFAVFEPLSLEYLASGIKDNHDVRIFDMRIEDDLESLLNRYQPDVAGITAYTVHVNVAKALAEKIKKINSNIFIVVGGHHATVAPEDFTTPFIDLVVMGEGVFTFRELIDRLEGKKDIDGITGTAYKKNGEIIIIEKRDIDDLDSFPFPDRDFTKKYRRHYFSEWMRPLASIRTSKGCHFKCNFCALWKLTGGKYLTRTPGSIIDELQSINEDYIFFADDESLLDVDRMNTLADLIKQRGIRKRYFLYGRSDTIVKYPDLIEKWKKIGLERVFVGLEFFRDADLKEIRKGSTTENNTKAIKILQSLNIDIFPNFMVRHDFDRSDFIEFRKYCLNLDLEFIGFSVMTPLPGTDLYEDVKNELITTNYDFYDFFHTHLPTKLPLIEFYREYASLFSKSRSIFNQFAFMRKYPIREIPLLFKTFNKFMKQLKNINNDYLN